MKPKPALTANIFHGPGKKKKFFDAEFVKTICFFDPTHDLVLNSFRWICVRTRSTISLRIRIVVLPARTSGRHLINFTNRLLPRVICCVFINQTKRNHFFRRRKSPFVPLICEQTCAVHKHGLDENIRRRNRVEQPLCRWANESLLLLVIRDVTETFRIGHGVRQG